METRVCKYCGKEKPLEMFSYNQWGHTHCCKECVSERMKSGIRKRLVGEVKPEPKWHRKTKQRARIEELEALLESAKDKRLDDFTPRELFVHLKKLGFKWERMYYTRIEEVDWNKI